MTTSKTHTVISMTPVSLRVPLYFVFGLAAWGIVLPQPAAAQRTNQESPSAPVRPASSVLDQENFSRVAASAEQIREVPVKDQGLLVELKRLVAAEATANGQLVDEFDLTDQAIFDRLGDDVSFRASSMSSRET